MRIAAPNPIALVSNKVNANVERRPNPDTEGSPTLYFCRACGCLIHSPEITLRPDMEHGATIACESCGAFLAWTGTILLKNLLQNNLLN